MSVSINTSISQLLKKEIAILPVVDCPLIIITHPMTNVNLSILPYSDIKAAFGMTILKQSYFQINCVVFSCLGE